VLIVEEPAGGNVKGAAFNLPVDINRDTSACPACYFFSKAIRYPREDTVEGLRVEIVRIGIGMGKHTFTLSVLVVICHSDYKTDPAPGETSTVSFDWEVAKGPGNILV
jgi:hypothetical protein